MKLSKHIAKSLEGYPVPGLIACRLSRHSVISCILSRWFPSICVCFAFSKLGRKKVELHNSVFAQFSLKDSLRRRNNPFEYQQFNQPDWPKSILITGVSQSRYLASDEIPEWTWFGVVGYSVAVWFLAWTIPHLSFDIYGHNLGHNYY